MIKQYYEITEDKDGKRIDIFNENWYKFEDTFYPSVTFILSQITDKNLANWFKEVGMNANMIRDLAGEIGSEFHRIVELFLKSGEIDYKDVNPKYFLEVWQRFDNFANFYETHLKGLEIIGIEKQVFNHNYKYAGTVDLITPGQIWDWKTSKDVHENHKIQLSAYANCFEDIEKVNIVVFPEHPRTKQGYSICSLDRSQIENYFELFQWHKINFARNIKEPKFKYLPTNYRVEK